MTCCIDQLMEWRLVSVPDSEVVARMYELKSDPDTDSGYYWTARLLVLEGYYIDLGQPGGSWVNRAYWLRDARPLNATAQSTGWSLRSAPFMCWRWT